MSKLTAGARETYGNREWLAQEYVHKKRSSIDIANQLGVSYQSICSWLKKHGIQARTSADASRLPNSRMKNSIKQSGPHNPFYGKHLSEKHKDNIRKATIGLRTKESAPGWKGGRRKTSAGYMKILTKEHPEADDKGYVYEHRLVAEKTLGRRLKANEVVHHLNENPLDNRPENLMVMDNKKHLDMHRHLLSALPDEKEPGK